MKPGRALALALLLGAPAAAQDAPAGARAGRDDPAVSRVRTLLADDPAFAEAAAARIARSRLAGLLAPGTDPEARRAAVREWVARDPDSAARLALGLAGDDRRGDSAFEDGAARSAATYYVANPGAQRGVYHRLRRAVAAVELPRVNDDASSEERLERLRALFEDRGAARGAASRGGENDPRAARTEPVAALAGAYDRLSAVNPRGYSPQVLALQSEFNARRPPEAPRLAETGRLDRATLASPAYGMERDLRLLERSLGRPEPDALARARAAADAFARAAGRAQDPAAITRERILELGRLRREAARWIAAAAVERDLREIASREGFLTPELLAAVDAVPAAAEERAAYKRAGEALRRRAAKAAEGLRRAAALLSRDGRGNSLAEADALIAENRALWRGTDREIARYASVPARAAEAARPRPRWRVLLDELALAWLPGSSRRARRAAERRALRAEALAEFRRIASSARRRNGRPAGGP